MTISNATYAIHRRLSTPQRRDKTFNHKRYKPIKHFLIMVLLVVEEASPLHVLPQPTSQTVPVRHRRFVSALCSLQLKYVSLLEVVDAPQASRGMYFPSINILHGTYEEGKYS